MFDDDGWDAASGDESSAASMPEPEPEPWNRPNSAVRPDGYAALELQSATVHPSELTDAEVIEAIRGYHHVVSWAEARQARMLAEFAHRRPPDRSDAVDRHTLGPVSAWAPDEIGLALTLSRGTAAARLERSVRLARVLPATLAAWDAGLLDLAKVNAIHDATLALSDTAAVAVQDRVMPKAPGQTVAQLRAALERAVIAADPEGANVRHRRAYRQRRVALNPDRDGMASLWALLSAPDAVTCYGWLTALARGLPATDSRSMDARRADLLVALLTGNLLIDPTGSDDSADRPAAGDDASRSAAESSACRPAADDSASRSAAVGSAGCSAERGRLAPATDCGSSGCMATGGAPGEDTMRGDALGADIPVCCAAEGQPDCGEDRKRRVASGAAIGRQGPGAGAAGGDATNASAIGGEPACGGLGGGDPAADGPVRPAEPFARTDLPAPVAPAKPLVHLVMPLTTLTGADDSPVDLIGYGPLPPALARDIAADAVWKRLVTDPLSGALLDHGRATYRPPAALADYVRARDRHCRMPICRRRALDAQLDHTIGYHTHDGTTDARNLYNACLCHHRMKDAPGWSVAQHPDGSLTWTTPTGHRYSSQPFDYRPEPDLAAVIAAPDDPARDNSARSNSARDDPARGEPARSAVREYNAGTGAPNPRRSRFDLPAPPVDPTDPPPF